MRLPTPPQIADAPELAALALADHALELLRRSLVAADPGLVNQDEDLPTGHSRDELSLALINLGAMMQQLIRRYIERLECDGETGLDIHHTPL